MDLNYITALARRLSRPQREALLSGDCHLNTARMMQSMGLCDALEPGDPKGTHRYRPIWSPLGLAVKARLEEATPAATALRQEQE